MESWAEVAEKVSVESKRGESSVEVMGVQREKAVVKAGTWLERLKCQEGVSEVRRSVQRN